MDRKVASLVCIFVLFLSFTIGMVFVKREVDVAGSRNSDVATVYGANEATPKYGGTLRVGVNFYPDNLNPLTDSSIENGYPAVSISRNMFGGLVRFDENGSVVPDLAQSWNVSEDCSSFTFNLYHNVTWHDGVKFNASDVKFTLDTILFNSEAQDTWRLMIQNCNVSLVTIVDEYTINVSLQCPKASFLNKIGLVQIIPWHLYEDTDLATNPYNDNPIGTGPFKFVSWNRRVNMTLAANELYHRGRPYLDEVFLRLDINRSQLTDMLLNNIIDVVPSSVDPNSTESLQQVPGVTVYNPGLPMFEDIRIKFPDPILDDVRVRKALAYAINRSEICEIAYLGLAAPARGPVPPVWTYWYDPTTPEYLCNKTRAEELLDEAGYSRDSETNIRFTLNFSIPTSATWRRRASEIVRIDWQDVGVETNALYGGSVEDWDCGWENYIMVSDPGELSDAYRTNAAFNGGNYSNAQIDHLLDQGETTLDKAERKQIYDELQLQLADDLPSIFVTYPDIAVAYHNDFHGFIRHPAGPLDPFILERIWYERTLSGEGNCPYRVCFTDSEGRRTGFHDGMAYEDIPDSTYSGIDSDPQVVKIREPSGNYTVELVGTEDGPYKFEFANLGLDYEEYWIPEGFIYENQTVPFTVRVNEDGSIDRYWHNLGITGITPSKTVVGQDCAMDLNVSVSNWGNFTETFNVTVYANATRVATLTNLTLPAHNSTTVSCTWNTVYSASGTYTVSAYAWPVPSETNTADNTFTDGTVQVTPNYPAPSGGSRKCVW